MNPVQYVADTDFGFTSVCRRSEMALLVLVAFVCLASATPQQQATDSIVIDLSVVDDKAQAVPQARIEIRAQGQLLATALTDAAGRAKATLQGRPSLQLTVSKQGYLATSTVLEIKANTGPTEVEVVLAKAELSQQSVDVHGTASNPVAEESSSQATIAPAQAQETPGRPGDSGRYITSGSRCRSRKRRECANRWLRRKSQRSSCELGRRNGPCYWDVRADCAHRQRPECFGFRDAVPRAIWKIHGRCGHSRNAPGRPEMALRS